MVEIIRRECKFVRYLPLKNTEDDIHIIKETLFYSNGKQKDVVRVIKDLKLPFYILQKKYRVYKQKKESEDIKKLIMYKARRKDLIKAAATRLGINPNKNNLRNIVLNSPYVYGLDISSEAYIQYQYLKKYGDLNYNYNRAFLDIEADVNTGELSILSVTYEDEIIVYITEDFIKNFPNYKESIKKLCAKHIPDTEYKEKLKITLVKVKNELTAVLEAFKELHKRKPDFLAIHNMSYDIGKILEILKKNNYRPEDIFSDPSIPKEYRYFNFREAQPVLVTASGVKKNLSMEELWHVLTCSASFYVIDTMSTYNYIRVGAAKLVGGYGLDNILKHEVELGKLTFEDTNDKFKGPSWHIYMSRYKKLEYIVYNIFDTMSMQILDDNTLDLKNTIRLLAGISSFDIFSSSPKMIVNDLYFFYLERGRVLGTKGTKHSDRPHLGLDKWIVTLQAARIKQKDIPILKEKGLSHNIRGHTYDSDVTAAYPTAIDVANVSGDTTLRELVAIDGMEKEDFLYHIINSMFGEINAVSFCTTMYKTPELMDLIELDKEINGN